MIFPLNKKFASEVKIKTNAQLLKFKNFSFYTLINLFFFNIFTSDQCIEQQIS
jgi:hypothetical protein